MLYYKVIHLFFTKQAEHIHYFDIGVFDTRKLAEDAIEILKTKDGFSLSPERFYIIKVFRFRKPQLLNNIYWIDGFTTYTYTKQ